MGQHGQQADVPFPTAVALVQRGLADDLAFHEHDQGEVLLIINFGAPVAQQPFIAERTFNEQSFRLRHRLKKLAQPRLILPLQRPHDTFRPVPQAEVYRIFVQREFE